MDMAVEQDGAQSMRDRAIALAKMGFKVFPVQAGGKKPVVEKFYDVASSDLSRVAELWTGVFDEEADYNVGVLCDNLLIVDFDVKAGLEIMMQDVEAFLAKYPHGHFVKTPSGGFHAYYALPPGTSVANTAKKLGPTVDTRGHHGFVVGAGSEIGGTNYEWVVDEARGKFPPTSVSSLVIAPPDLIAAVGAPREKALASVDIELDTPTALAMAEEYLTKAPRSIEGNGGDATAYKVAAKIRELGISQPTALDLMAEIWNPDCEPPWSIEQLEIKIENAFRYATGIPRELGAEFEAIPGLDENGHTAETRPKVLPPIQSTELEYFDPTALPRRDWIVPGLLARGFVTGLVAPSGAGKTQFMSQIGLAVASGRGDLVGIGNIKRAKVWIWNQEDDLTELKRRIAAARIHFGLKHADTAGNLRVDSGVDRPLYLARRGRDGRLHAFQDVEAVIADIRKNSIDVLLVDPLVEFHEADENNNVEMRQVAALLRRIAVEGNCAVIIGHHTRKPDSASSQGFAGNADSGRGASALQGVTRIMSTLYAMTEKDAKAYGIGEEDRSAYVRLDGAKSNIALAAGGGAPNWFKRTSVPLGEGGEHVGALVSVALTKKNSRVKREGEAPLADPLAVAAADALQAAGKAPGERQLWPPLRMAAAAAIGADGSSQGDFRGLVRSNGHGVRIPAGKGREIEFVKQLGASKGVDDMIILHLTGGVEGVADTVGGVAATVPH